MTGLGDWIIAYLQHLRPELRADTGDRRLQDAARLAIDNGWHPKQMAAAVGRRDYTGGRNPVLLAIIRLEQLSETKPGLATRKHRRGHPNGCAICTEDMVCEDPAVVIPQQWAAERLLLINRLAAIPPADLTEDEREQRMVDLIAEQRTRGHGRLPR